MQSESASPDAQLKFITYWVTFQSFRRADNQGKLQSIRFHSSLGIHVALILRDHAVISRACSLGVPWLHCQSDRDQLVNLYANRVRLSQALIRQQGSLTSSRYEWNSYEASAPDRRQSAIAAINMISALGVYSVNSPSEEISAWFHHREETLLW